jgi:hypothetical protein
MPGSSRFVVRDLRRLTSLRPAEIRLVAYAGLALPVAAIALRALGVRRVHAALGGWRPGGAVEGLDAHRVARLFAAAARRMPGYFSCLPRAVALQWILARHGCRASLRIGVRKQGEVLDAHAWVEHEGIPLMERPGIAEEYAPFDPLERAART